MNKGTVIYLAYGSTPYQDECDPIKAFSLRSEAEAFAARLQELRSTKPKIDSSAGAEGMQQWNKRVVAWKEAHPAGADHAHHHTFAVMEIPFD